MLKQLLVAVSMVLVAVIGVKPSTAPLAFAVTDQNATVIGTANIFGAGHAVAPGPGGSGGGSLPTGLSVADAETVQFVGVQGSVTCCGIYWANNADGGGCCGVTDMSSYGGISGLKNSNEMFLAGVFLNNSEPFDPAPQRLDFTNNRSFLDLSPGLRQTFFIGDGLTGAGSGTLQNFHVPIGATRLFLGFMDGGSFIGLPGSFQDNQGALTMTVRFVGPTPAVPAVLLVHGYDFNGSQEECKLDNLKQWLADSANTSGQPFSVHCLEYRTREGVIAGASSLRDYIDRNIAQGSKVDIVAHSMGGLVARYYIEKLDGGHRDRVRSLTMLGTPNLGTPAAIYPCFLFASGQTDQGACDLVPLSSLLRDLNNNLGSHSGVSYKVITGDVGTSTLGTLFLTKIPRPNDCVVPVHSAFGDEFPYNLGFPHDAPVPVSHVTESGVIASLSGCTANGETEDNGVRQQVASILLASNGLAGESVDSGGSAGTPAETAGDSSLAAESRLITQGQTRDSIVPMPAGQASGSFLFRTPDAPNVALELALIRPDGSTVQASDQDTTFLTATQPGDIDQTQWVMINPVPGDWTMRVTGEAVPTEGWPYDVEALVPGGIDVTASAGAGHYDVGQSVPLSAQVTIDGTPVAASPNAAITKPDGSTVQVNLTDGGNGNYVGKLSDTSSCGMYQVVVTASGMDGGTPFTRVGRALVVVGVPGNAILDPCNADSDGDGLTDNDELNVYSTSPAAADTDTDGCGDGKEVGTNQMLGGRRDPTNPWDYMNPTHDHQNRVDDILMVVHQFFKDSGNPAYNVDTDRTLIGPNAWNLGPPDGLQRVDDILNSVKQFFHDC